MNTVIFVVGAMWVLPIIALLLANLVLSMDQRRTLTALAGDRVVREPATARSIVRSATREGHGVPVGVASTGGDETYDEIACTAIASVTSGGMTVGQPLRFQISLN